VAKKQIFCVDRVIPYHRKDAAAEAALRENPANHPRMPRLLPGVSQHRAKISMLVGKRWRTGRILRVRFLDGSRFQRERVRRIARRWCDHANLILDFDAGKEAEIRISFAFDRGSSWSAVGTDCLDARTFPGSQPTMNFGWLDDDTDEIEYRRVVLHEFGHALGAVHEHQVPSGGIEWNTARVYATFSGPPNYWSKEEIDFNIIRKYSMDQLNGTRFDSKSIMLYSFPPELIRGPASFKRTCARRNLRLSAKDKSFIRKFYPAA
jgi:hypothetical protein